MSPFGTKSWNHGMRSEQPSTTSGVYFIECAGARAIKIGYASNVLSRLREFQCANPYPLRLLAVLPGVPRKMERDLHLQFSLRCLMSSGGGTEWFRDSPEIREFIASNASTFEP